MTETEVVEHENVAAAAAGQCLGPNGVGDDVGRGSDNINAAVRIVGDAPMARLGQRLVNGTARKMMEEFFANFARAL